MVTHAQNPSTQETESGGFLGTPGQHGLHNEILSQPKQTKCPPKQTAATKSTTEKEFKYVETPVIEWVPGHLFILLPYPTVQHKKSSMSWMLKRNANYLHGRKQFKRPGWLVTELRLVERRTFTVSIKFYCVASLGPAKDEQSQRSFLPLENMAVTHRLLLSCAVSSVLLRAAT